MFLIHCVVRAAEIERSLGESYFSFADDASEGGSWRQRVANTQSCGSYLCCDPVKRKVSRRWMLWSSFPVSTCRRKKGVGTESGVGSINSGVKMWQVRRVQVCLITGE